MEGIRPVRTQWAVMPQLPQRQQRVRSKVLPFQDKRSGWSTIAGYAQRTWCGNHVQAISLDERAPRPIVSPVVCSWSFRCAACLPLLSFFLFFAGTICTHKLLIAHSSRGCVTRCSWPPMTLAARYGTCVYDWGQRPSTIHKGDKGRRSSTAQLPL